MAGKENVFPLLYLRNIPEVVTKIFLHVNYVDHLHRFRLVSTGWRDFIQREIVGKPCMRELLSQKDFVEAWIRRPPSISSPSPWVFPEQRRARHTRMYVSNDCIFIDDNSNTTVTKTNIYRNLEFVGYVVAPSHSLPKLVPCNDYFVDIAYDSRESFKLKAYKKVNDECGQLIPHDLMPTIHMFRIIALRSLDADRLILVYLEKSTSKIVIRNLADGSEKRVTVSRLGNSDGDLYADVHALVEDKELAILWRRERFLQMIDYKNEKEIWMNDHLQLDGHWKQIQGIVGKTSAFTCLGCRQDVVQIGTCLTLHFYDSKTSDLVNCFSVHDCFCELPWCSPIASFGSTFVWTRNTRDRQHWPALLEKVSVRDGSYTRLELRSSRLKIKCALYGAIVKAIHVIGNRIALLEYFAYGNGSRNLVAVDLLSGSNRVLVSGDDCSFQLDVSEGKICCWNYEEQILEILHF